VSRIFLEKGKSANFLFLRGFQQSNRNSKGSGKKTGNSRGEQGLTILEFGGHGGYEHFGTSEGKGG